MNNTITFGDIARELLVVWGEATSAANADQARANVLTAYLRQERAAGRIVAVRGRRDWEVTRDESDRWLTLHKDGKRRKSSNRAT